MHCLATFTLAWPRGFSWKFEALIEMDEFPHAVGNFFKNLLMHRHISMLQRRKIFALFVNTLHCNKMHIVKCRNACGMGLQIIKMSILKHWWLKFTMRKDDIWGVKKTEGWKHKQLVFTGTVSKWLKRFDFYDYYPLTTLYA